MDIKSTPRRYSKIQYFRLVQASPLKHFSLSTQPKTTSFAAASVTTSPLSTSERERHARRAAFVTPANGPTTTDAPPLSMTSKATRTPDRRDVSLRWLAACVLIGVTGAGLLGTAISVSLQSDTGTIEPAEFVAAPTLDTPARTRDSSRKGDKLVKTSFTSSARTTVRLPMSVRAGERESIKQRPVSRIRTALAQTVGVYATDIPPFNPVRFLMEDTRDEKLSEAPPEPSDADVSILKKDLHALILDDAGFTLSEADVQAQLADMRRKTSSSPSPSLDTGLPSPFLLSAPKTPLSLPDSVAAQPTMPPFSTLDVQVVPENVTVLEKSEGSKTSRIEEQEIVLKRGDNLEALLRKYGANAEQAKSILALLGDAGKSLVDGQRMRLLILPSVRSGTSTIDRYLSRVILYGETGILGIVAADDRGVYAAITPAAEERATKVAEEEPESDDARPTLYESLFETVQKYDLPRTVAEDLIRIFGYDVDLQRRISDSDALEIVFTEEDDSGVRFDMLYVALTVDGEKRTVYRYVSPEDSTLDHLDDEGRSLRKFLVRKPIATGEMRSGFGYRRHPILGYSKMHTGVDWAAPIGTPIFAAGNGTVLKAEWDGGYGRRVELQHTNGYVTTYNHMSGFGRGIQPGARVRQGQVVGYLGSTGLSTGPHLHYEVMINSHFVDPLKIRLPRGRELEGRMLAEFKRQREQIQAIVQKVVTAEAGGSGG
jgi:murein DD-endopeptidase MepM/ murein hydrolase activator NlpD